MSVRKRFISTVAGGVVILMMTSMKPSMSFVPAGNYQLFELVFAHGGDAANIAEVENRDMRSIGEDEISRLRVGVVQRIAKDHLEVHVGGRPHERVDVPSRGRAPARSQTAYRESGSW